MSAPNEKLADKVEEILSQELPEIKIKLSEVSSNQNRTMDKINDMDDALKVHIGKADEFYRIVTTHEMRLASIEKIEAEDAQGKALRTQWMYKVSAGAAIAVLSAIAGYVIKIWLG